MCSIMFNDVQFVFRLQSIVAYCRLYNKMYYIYTYNMYIYCKYITPYHTSIYIHVCINFSCPATVTVIRSSPQEHQQLSAGDRTAPGRCEGKRRGAPKDQRGAYRQLQMHDVFVSRFYRGFCMVTGLVVEFLPLGSCGGEFMMEIDGMFVRNI